METFSNRSTCISVMVRMKSTLTNIIDAPQISDCPCWSWLYSFIRKSDSVNGALESRSHLSPSRLPYKIMEQTCCSLEHRSLITSFSSEIYKTENSPLHCSGTAELCPVSRDWLEFHSCSPTQESPGKQGRVM